MLIPPLRSRVKEGDEASRFRIQTRQVRTLVQVAPVASQGQVGPLRLATMFAGNDVLDMKAGKRDLRLCELAVLEAKSGA